MICRSRLLLLAPVLLATLSGCGVWDAWKYRMGYQQPSRTAANYGYSQGRGTTLQPGHSTDADEFNENYAPYAQPPADGAADHIVPPPAPPARSDIPPANPNQPLIEQDVNLQNSADSESKLIKTLKTPKLFSPDGVRSIYDRFRNSEAEQAPAIDKPSGPIAQNRITPSPNRHCQYSDDEAHAAVSPVRLGLPETDVSPSSAEGDVLAPTTPSVRTVHDNTTRAAVMQASPSSYRHPLLADPTGVSYGSR